jgi:hypothetical protein
MSGADQTPWKWTFRFGMVLSASVAAFAAWGALAPHIPMPEWAPPLAAGALMAALYGNSQALANCMAANARRAWDRGGGFQIPTLFFACCFVGFALMSMAGLHSAWDFVKANSHGAPLPDDGLMRLLFWFVAFAEPALNYGVEALKGLYRLEESEQERAWRDDAAKREERQREAEARRNALSVVAAPMAAAIATASVASAVEVSDAEFPLDRISHSGPAATAVEAHKAHGWRGPRDRARWERLVEAHEMGLSPAEIIRETGIPATTAYRWLQVLGDGAPRRGPRRIS